MTKKQFILIALFLVSSCAGNRNVYPAQIASPTVSKTPPPFSFSTSFPENGFLFIYLYDDNTECVDGLCNCPTIEQAMVPFEFQDKKLILNQYFFDPVPTGNWRSLRSRNNAMALYTNWSQSDVGLQTISGFPFEAARGNLLLLGANQQGDIQIRVNDEYVVVRNGSNFQFEQTGYRGIEQSDCKVLNKYTLYNYGFIEDNDVVYLYPQ